MMISSRTPEGDPARCPVCGVSVLMERSQVFNDAPCPACGSLLWFIQFGDLNLLVRPGPGAREKLLIAILAEATGLSEQELRSNLESFDLRADVFDSIQLTELLMKIEDATG